MRVCDAAVKVLQETENPAVMWGDTVLLHQIAIKAGIPSRQRASLTEKRVLDALTRQPGILIALKTNIPQTGRNVRIFRLPEAK